MTIAILGYGKEGKSVKNYFKDEEIKIFDNFTDDELKNLNLSNFSLVFRSPSVKPFDKSWTSVTKYFFDNCICPIIGITGTKGKGTTASLIAAILKSLDKTVHLVGNIGFPAIDILDKIQPTDIVVYELSSFQLWDLGVSPHISVILRIEPDHLNIHKNFDDYVFAKSNIAKFQEKSDSCIFFKDNESSQKIANLSPAKKFPYPLTEKSPKLTELLNSLNIPGKHNQENAEAALLAVSAIFKTPLETFISENFDHLKSTFENFKGLPHHIEFIRELNGVKYYDDNFSASSSSLEVAIKTFPNSPVFLIAGGKDRNLDLTPHKTAIFGSPNIKKVFLIGEIKEKLAKNEDENRFEFCDTLEDAVHQARLLAEEEYEHYDSSAFDNKKPSPIVLMSPGAASFDMFENFYDRGMQFQSLVKELK